MDDFLEITSKPLARSDSKDDQLSFTSYTSSSIESSSAVDLTDHEVQTDVQNVPEKLTPKVYVVEPEVQEKPKMNLEDVKDIPLDSPIFKNRDLRTQFIQKVYAVLSLKVFCCTCLVILCVYIEGVNAVLKTHWGIGLGMLTTYYLFNQIVFCCCWRFFVRRPTDVMLMTLQIVFLSGALGTLAVHFSTKVIVISCVAVTYLCLVLTLLTCQRRLDSTKIWIGLLIVIPMTFLVYGLFGFLVANLMFEADLSVWKLTCACLAVVMLCVHIVLHIQILFRNSTYQLTADMYVFAACLTLTDLMHVFVNILTLVRAIRPPKPAASRDLL